jgi:hypothetical protein
MGELTGARSLRSALRKLEAEAAERQRSCAYCLFRREMWPLPKGRSDESYKAAVMRCEFCLAKLKLGLPAWLLLHSYNMREKFTHTCEHLYTDKAVHAFWVWSSHKMAIFMLQGSSSAGGVKPRKPAPNRRLERIEGESNRLLMRRHKRLRAKYGEPFPEYARVVNSVFNREGGRASRYLHLGGFKALYDQETHHLVCAEMEKVIRGRVKPETESDVTELRREMDRFIAGGEERPRLKAEEDALREKEEAEARERAEAARARVPQKTNEPNMKGLYGFDFDAYERRKVGR